MMLQDTDTDITLKKETIERQPVDMGQAVVETEDIEQKVQLISLFSKGKHVPNVLFEHYTFYNSYHLPLMFNYQQLMFLHGNVILCLGCCLRQQKRASSVNTCAYVFTFLSKISSKNLLNKRFWNQKCLS